MLGFNSISEAPISTLAGGIVLIDISGQQITTSLGTVDAISSVLLTGQQLNTSVSSLTGKT